MIDIPAAAAVTASAAATFLVPAGVCTVILSNTGSTNVIYIGTTVNVTATNGFPLPVNATVTFTTHPGSTGVTLYAVAAGTGNNLGALISTAS